MSSQTPVEQAQAESRLRVVRYFSDVCSELVPEDVKAARIARVRDLEAKSDDELADLGLLRDDIVEFVYREARFI